MSVIADGTLLAQDTRSVLISEAKRERHSAFRGRVDHQLALFHVPELNAMIGAARHHEVTVGRTRQLSDLRRAAHLKTHDRLIAATLPDADRPVFCAAEDPLDLVIHSDR